MTTEKPIAGIWWRESTKAQLELSPETQIKESREKLEAEGYVVPEDRIIGAVWHSLDTLDCPEMQTLLSWMRQGEIQAVGMINSDRLSGEMAHKLAIIDIAKKHGVMLIAVQSPIGSGPEGELIETIRTYAKYLQVMRAQEGSRDGLRDRVMLKGLPATGGAPYGYRFHTDLDREGNRAQDCSRLIPDDNWYVARDIWRMGLEGTPLRSIIKTLRERGIKTSRGLPTWRTNAVVNILHNPVYAGRYYAFRKSYRLPGNGTGTNRYGKTTQARRPMDEWVYLPKVTVAEPIVSWNDFLHMQERLTMNKKLSRRNAKFPYLLRSLIRCEFHNRTYCGDINRGSHLYRCTGRAGASEIAAERCPRPGLGGEKLESQVWARAIELLANPERVLIEVERRSQTRRETEEGLLSSLAAVQKRHNALDQREMVLTSKWLEMGVSESTLKKQMALMNAERVWCDEEQDRLRQQLDVTSDTFATVEQVKALCERVGHRLDEATDEDKRFVLESLETKVTVAADGTIRVAFALPMPSAPTVSTCPSYSATPSESTFERTSPGRKCGGRWL